MSERYLTLWRENNGEKSVIAYYEERQTELLILKLLAYEKIFTFGNVRFG